MNLRMALSASSVPDRELRASAESDLPSRRNTIGTDRRRTAGRRHPDDGVEHRTPTSVGDREMTPEDLTRRGLLLERRRRFSRVRLDQRLVLLLQLGEQPLVLDGDDRLVREGREQGDLLVGEGADFLARRDAMTPIRSSSLQQRHAEHGTASALFDAGDAIGVRTRLGVVRANVRDMDRLRSCDGFARPTAVAVNAVLPNVLVQSRPARRMRCEPQRNAPSVELEQDRRICASQMRAAFSTMASNTGCRSNGELADDPFSTSAVAVC